jgi:hypothetical protein
MPTLLRIGGTLSTIGQFGGLLQERVERGLWARDGQAFFFWSSVDTAIERIVTRVVQWRALSRSSAFTCTSLATMLGDSGIRPMPSARGSGN